MWEHNRLKSLFITFRSVGGYGVERIWPLRELLDNVKSSDDEIPRWPYTQSSWHRETTTIGNYLRDVAQFLAPFLVVNVRRVDATQLCVAPVIQSILDKVSWWEKEWQTAGIFVCNMQNPSFFCFATFLLRIFNQCGRSSILSDGRNLPLPWLSTRRLLALLLLSLPPASIQLCTPLQWQSMVFSQSNMRERAPTLVISFTPFWCVCGPPCPCWVNGPTHLIHSAL
jgi:hypothetical protein